MTSISRLVIHKIVKEKISNLAQHVNDFLQESGPAWAVSGQQFIAGLCTLGVLLSLLFHKSLFIVALILEFASLVWYILTCKSAQEKARTSKLWARINMFLFAALLGLSPYCMFAKWFGASGAIVLVGLAFVVVALAIVTVFQFSESGKNVWEWLDNVGSSQLAKGNTGYKPGDVVLCDDKERLEAGDKDPREIIPYKDRFLHMLILGPTGGGKTSQVILPMVNQDVHNLEAGVTVIEPKGDLAREVAMMAKDLGRPYIYFDPSVDNCPFFNPLIGDESDVIENAVTTFLMLNPDSPQYFKDLSEQLVRNTLKVLKRLDKDKGIDGYYSTFIWMSRVLQNNGNQGRELVNKFSKISSATPDEAKENADIASWFMNEYFAERSKVYENSSGIRSQVAKVIANQYLRHILNPDVEAGEQNQIDFDKHLAEGGVICISTAQGLLRDLGKFLGYFIILQLQSAVFRRPGNEDNRRAHFLYIDEFQTYSTPGFADMLTQGRSYRVASHLATQARAQMAMGGGRDGKNFVELVSTNARNIVIFPGGSKDDAKFYSEQFGEYEKIEVVKSQTHKRFNLITGGLDRLGHPSESVREQAKMTANFSPSDIIYRPFGEIIYCIIKNNSIQTPKVGKVKWLDMEYDKRLKQMIEDEIVTHEYRYIKEHEGEGEQKPESATGDIDWGAEEDETEVNAVPVKPSIPTPPQKAPEQSIEEGLGEEPVDTTPDGRKVEMFEDQCHDDNDWTHGDMFSPSEEDDFKFDDDHGDPLCDDDLI